MVFWIKEISWKKVILSGAIFTVISFVIRQVEALLTMGYYTDPQYFGLWSKLMMPSNGPPPAEFMITSLVFTFVTGVSLALIYYYLRKHLPENKKQRIFYFADLMVAMSFLFFTLPAYLMFNIPVGILVSWFIASFIILLSASFIFVKIIK
ncbi:MAG: hypothetical protein US39_C0006G0045 [Microgenomates group bacterium GW2011_GWC1_37_12b]|uniref:Uncharacterized protein n=1 Tax=Candidatus Woesebacteria bacterium GW2011_GWB1_38_8b TaxID=1618571 RepID=A0A0G0LHK0_9BACT|nr:MAG: hypothetical protein US39_C0006G0045 [Microgenomates group bacterium GW2011_GWC1_37_12b]KKQ87415.1 MAG: hypothetical protein UT10_C0007G0073 [Candidatus Woesebacteria bacterium GW2011_GWB1_38_8b]